MEEAIENVANEIEGGYKPKSEDYSPLTREAIRIAEVALISFNGELLDKALTISKAIVDFESELINTSTS